MLHAFHDSQDTATDGSELFAYIPSSLHASLSELADPTYGHEFFVNGTQTVGDACWSYFIVYLEEHISRHAR